MRLSQAILLGLFACACATGWSVGGAAAVQEPPRDGRRSLPPEAKSDTSWKWESVTLKDGVQYRGLIVSESKSELEFAEIRQPPGKPMYAVVRGIDTSQIKVRQMLPPEQHEQMLSRFMRFKNRARIEAGRIEDVQLAPPPPSKEGWVYRGQWFDLVSTADADSTRRCVVRIEQIFRAYRQILPPREATTKRLRVRLFGSTDEYQGFLQRERVNLDNPAFYSARRNLIVAGSDLSRYRERLLQVQRENEAVLQQYKKLDEDFRQRLISLSQQLRQRGFSPKEIEFERNQRQAAWERQFSQARNKIKEINRANESRFAQITSAMFARLNHEAFHAYLDNFVAPTAEHAAPRWLNEGLAQIFENGQLELGALRIDAPHRPSLRQLQRDLRSGAPLLLADLLHAEQYEFLVTHAAGSSQRHYLYSWGLTFYLTFHRDLLKNQSLRQYIRSAQRSGDPVRHFEQLVGQPLSEFEQAWRETMLDLR